MTSAVGDEDLPEQITVKPTKSIHTKNRINVERIEFLM
jgi:hypothetical protein